MKKGFAIVGAAAGFLWGLLAVLLSDGTSSSAWGEIAMRAAVLCIFVALGAVAGMVVGWVAGLFFRGK
ncbi:MAG: hypothetical protein EXS31_10605 [Pedosphaera sp.]|nr:hypothetical protein [Pedosphaera sp.]